jgi:hypothetical protein
MGHGDRTGGPSAIDEGDRKLRHLLAGDFLLYEVTTDRELRVLRFPRRFTRPAGSSGRAFPRGASEAPPSP